MRRRNYQRDAALFRGGETRRLLLMVFLLAMLGMAMRQTADPAAWRWLTRDAAASDEAAAIAPQEAAAIAPKAPESRQPSAAASNEDLEEAEAARQQFEAITDFTPLAPEEMPAYWRLMKWAAAESFDALQARAQRGVLYTQLWEEPSRYRGKPILLKLHLRRTLCHDAPKNSAGVKTVYEAWGHTNESKSLPYLVVFAEPPAGMPLGDPIRDEGVFVGYFLKNMGYEAFDKQRGSPLLIGRLQRLVAAPAAINPASERTWFWWTLGLGCLVMLGMFVFWVAQRNRTPADRAAPPAEFDTWLRHVEQSTEHEPGPDDKHTGV